LGSISNDLYGLWGVDGAGAGAVVAYLFYTVATEPVVAHGVGFGVDEALYSASEAEKGGVGEIGGFEHGLLDPLGVFHEDFGDSISLAVAADVEGDEGSHRETSWRELGKNRLP